MRRVSALRRGEGTLSAVGRAIADWRASRRSTLNAISPQRHEGTEEFGMRRLLKERRKTSRAALGWADEAYAPTWTVQALTAKDAIAY